jgi:hypothetical protein
MVINVPFFEHMRSKYAKDAKDPNNFWVTKVSMGYQKTQNFMLIPNL